ncbi:protein of unknown function [Burkholderia multivorans]
MLVHIEWVGRYKLSVRSPIPFVEPIAAVSDERDCGYRGHCYRSLSNRDSAQNLGT